MLVLLAAVHGSWNLLATPGPAQGPLPRPGIAAAPAPPASAGGGGSPPMQGVPPAEMLPKDSLAACGPISIVNDTWQAVRQMFDGQDPVLARATGRLLASDDPRRQAAGRVLELQRGDELLPSASWTSAAARTGAASGT